MTSESAQHRPRPAAWRRHVGAPTLVTSLVVALFITLVLAWPVPMALLKWGVESHSFGTLRPWRSASGVECGASISRAIFSDAVYIQVISPEDSRLPMGDRASIPAWAGMPSMEQTTLRQVDTGASGWPFRAFASESWQFKEPDELGGKWREELRGNVVLFSSSLRRTILPLRPIWLGLLGNIGVFTLAGLCVAWVWRSWRASRRARRGLCPACAYNLEGILEGAACPECGQPSAHAPSPTT